METEVGTATVSVLFCDVVGSTELLSHLGDDANDDVRRAWHVALREAVRAHRGQEVKNLGDGLMVVFPTSVADALACGVAMHRAIDRLGRRNPVLRLAIRVGISVGEATTEDNDWFGTPVVEAARLCAAGQSGQIMATDVVRALVGTRG
ncbi:MAG: adenylate/guanylate cyclase domain-containing protein, partial [Actinomycetota bacterium]|nr:adenylate/guanylate cyclase domain-containing protein [Actinomycetota bacterium]